MAGLYKKYVSIVSVNINSRHNLEVMLQFISAVNLLRNSTQYFTVKNACHTKMITKLL